MLLAVQPVNRHGFAFLEQGQFSLFVFLRIVHPFTIDCYESRKNQGLPGRPEKRIRMSDGNVQAYRVELGGAHLAGDGPLPDDLVKPRLVLIEVFRNDFRGPCYRSRPDRLVRFLGILHLALVDVRLLRKIAGVEIPSYILPDILYRLPGKRERIRPHVGDETDCGAAYVYALVELLRSPHCPVGGHAKLSDSLLLKRGSGEGRRCMAHLALLLYTDDPPFPGLKEFIQDFLLLLFAPYVELL